MSGGMIIRLIDVVLIILFGFIAISDIQVKRPIRLPGPSREKQREQETRLEYIFVTIDGAGFFTVKHDERVRGKTNSVTQLKQQLVALARALPENKQPLIVIDPARDAIMQRTVDVFDVCEEANLPKSINLQN